jgi:hypothetical protein
MFVRCLIGLPAVLILLLMLMLMLVLVLVLVLDLDTTDILCHVLIPTLVHVLIHAAIIAIIKHRGGHIMGGFRHLRRID